ncbi:MAG: YfiR family protein, partial [Gammaproteobacteria bacterium]|nr:YfiR family protein [Gammaproteobacteria bacterium]
MNKSSSAIIALFLVVAGVSAYLAFSNVKIFLDEVFGFYSAMFAELPQDSASGSAGKAKPKLASAHSEEVSDGAEEQVRFLPEAASEMEYRVKAVFLYKIIRLVEWPEDSFEGPHTPFALCLFGEDYFGKALDRYLHKKVKRRVFSWKKVSYIKEISDCHMVFISCMGQGRLEAILSSLKNQPVLTVGDTKSFAERGIMLNLVKTNNGGIHIEINLRAMERAGLKIDPRLLHVGKIVDSANKSDEYPASVPCLLPPAHADEPESALVTLDPPAPELAEEKESLQADATPTPFALEPADEMASFATSPLLEPVVFELGGETTSFPVSILIEPRIVYDEHLLKAISLYDIAHVAEWPDDASADDASPLFMCTVGEGPIGNAIEAIRYNTVRNRPLLFEKNVSLSKVTQCHLLFIDKTEQEYLPDILSAVENLPVLTIGETESFTEEGGMISLVEKNGLLDIVFNPDAAEHAQLKVDESL